MGSSFHEQQTLLEVTWPAITPRQTQLISRWLVKTDKPIALMIYRLMAIEVSPVEFEKVVRRDLEGCSIQRCQGSPGS